MKHKGSRSYFLLSIFFLALSQIMCDAVTKKFPEETYVISGVEVDESQLESDVFNVEANMTRSDCPGNVPIPEMGLVESFEFSDKSLVITHPNESVEYTKIETLSGRISYCRQPDPNYYICIDFRDENSYQIHVYHYTAPNRVCYAADRYLTSVDDLLLNDDSANESEDSNDAVQNNHTCNATQYLHTSGVNLQQEINQFDTRLCGYTLRITNTHPTAPIRYFVYQHDRDGFQHTEGYMWLGNYPLQPGIGTDSLGRIAIYTDKDADGPVMSIPEKVAGIYDSPECSIYYKDAKFDEDFLEKIAVPIVPVCPVE